VRFSVLPGPSTATPADTIPMADPKSITVHVPSEKAETGRLERFRNGNVRPWKMNGRNLQITRLERKIIFQTSIFSGLHVNPSFWGSQPRPTYQVVSGTIGDTVDGRNPAKRLRSVDYRIPLTGIFTSQMVSRMNHQQYVSRKETSWLI